MNIVFITQEDPFYVRVFFEEFFSAYPDKSEIKAVVIAPTMGKKSLWSLVRQMYGFYGLINFFKVGFRYVGYKIGAGFSRFLPVRNNYSIEQVCHNSGIAVIHAQDINSEEFLNRFDGMGLDLIVSVAAPQIFREKLISIPKKGCINIHNAELPKYRGMLPNFWQMYHGEKKVGTTIHRINPKLDDGDILFQKTSPIEPGETLDSLIIRTKIIGALFMVQALEKIAADDTTSIPNRNEDATYFTFPTNKDIKEFKRRGYRVI